MHTSNNTYSDPLTSTCTTLITLPCPTTSYQPTDSALHLSPCMQLHLQLHLQTPTISRIHCDPAYKQQHLLLPSFITPALNRSPCSALPTDYPLTGIAMHLSSCMYLHVPLHIQTPTTTPTLTCPTTHIILVDPSYTYMQPYTDHSTLPSMTPHSPTYTYPPCKTKATKPEPIPAPLTTPPTRWGGGRSKVRWGMEW